MDPSIVTVYTVLSLAGVQLGPLELPPPRLFRDIAECESAMPMYEDMENRKAERERLRVHISWKCKLNSR